MFLKQIYKFSSFIILGFSVIIFYFTFDASKISTNMLDLFPNVEQRELLDIHSALEKSITLLISTKHNVKELEGIKGLNYIIPLKENIYLLDISKDIKLETFYNDFKERSAKFDDLRYFSQDFLSIENSSAIFDDVNLIMVGSVCFLIVLYLFILRIPFLSLNTLLTIISANLLGICVITNIYNSVNVMALNFGVAIGNLAIDYMLHHHFFKLYVHRFSFNKSVFYGFITTFLGFGICLLIPFPLLSQLSLYAMVCLLVSYLSFSILYQYIGFKKPVFYRNLRKLRKPRVKNSIVLVFGVLVLCFSVPNLKLDYNLERLDYENKARLSDKDFFINELPQHSTILVFGDSKEELNARVAKILGEVELKSDVRNLNIVESNGRFYTKFDVSPNDLEHLRNIEYVDTRTIKQLSDEITSGIYKPMLNILSVVIIIMVVIVFIVTKSLVSFSYTLIPLSAISLYLLSTEVNIMHLFSLLIVVVSSVDYGIYVEKEGENIRTLHAIIFSAITTIAGFGFLSFSNILALNSFGTTISLGLVVILLLLLFQKRNKGV